VQRRLKFWAKEDAAPEIESPRERIYLVSPAGTPNYGDDFIAAAWLRYLADAKPEADVWLDCHEPGRAAVMLDGLHPRLRTTDTLWQLIDQFRSSDWEHTAEGVCRMIRDYGSPRVDLGILLLRGATSLHLLGGGYINDVWPENISLLAAVAEVKALTGARLLATGQGLLPLEGASVGEVASRLREFDYAESRDQPGADLLGVTKGLDDAFLGVAQGELLRRAGGRSAEEWAEARPNELPDVMVLLQGDFRNNADAEHLKDVTESFLKAQLADGAQSIGFVESIPGVDRLVFEMLSDEFRETRYFPASDLWLGGFPAAPGQRWLTSRFHFHMLSAAAGASGVFVNMSPGYYDIKHGSLLELGTGWTELAIGGEEEGPVPAPTANQDFPARAAELGRRKVTVADELYR